MAQNIPSSLRRRAAALVAIATLAVFTRAQPAPSLVHHPAPAFSLPALDRTPVSLAQDRGDVVLLNFWATWCAPCRLEMPQFTAWQKQYGPQGLRVIGVSIDDTEPPVRAFADKLHLNYPIVMGDAKLGERYGGILGVPVTFLIDRKGIIRARYNGESDLGVMHTRILRLLAEDR